MTPQRSITSQNTFPAVKIDFGGYLPDCMLIYPLSAVISEEGSLYNEADTLIFSFEADFRAYFALIT